MAAKGYRYSIPINEKEGDDGTVSMDVITLYAGRPAKRRRQMRHVMRTRYGLSRDQVTKVIEAMGFTDLM
jgi:hypothetical protein